MAARRRYNGLQNEFDHQALLAFAPFTMPRYTSSLKHRMAPRLALSNIQFINEILRRNVLTIYKSDSVAECSLR